VQRDFLKFTGQQILKHLRNKNAAILTELLVNAKDRKYQVWERNSLSISILKPKVFWQKIDYIHYNPLKSRLCKNQEDYKYSKYSSVRFYEMNGQDWDFLVHYKD